MRGPIFTPLEDHGPQSPAREISGSNRTHPKDIPALLLGKPCFPLPFHFWEQTLDSDHLLQQLASALSYGSSVRACAKAGI